MHRDHALTIEKVLFCKTSQSIVHLYNDCLFGTCIIYDVICSVIYSSIRKFNGDFLDVCLLNLGTAIDVGNADRQDEMYAMPLLVPFAELVQPVRGDRRRRRGGWYTCSVDAATLSRPWPIDRQVVSIFFKAIAAWNALQARICAGCVPPRTTGSVEWSLSVCA